MAASLWTTLLCLLVHGCFCSQEQVEKGCMKWRIDESNANNVCCDICHPGNRLVSECGPSPKDLCTPCEPRKFAVGLKPEKCSPCTQCVGAQVLLKACTPTHDAVCGCKDGLECGDVLCSFCVTACGKGQEPLEDGGCRSCPNGTFNDQIHQRCKPWSTRCQDPNQKIVTAGDAFTDIECEDATDVPAWPVVRFLLPGLVLAFILIIIVIIIFSVRVKLQQEKQAEKVALESPVIGTPTDTDDHMTLIAIECSFHEAEQEQGSSLDSLVSEDSTKELID